MTEDRSHIPNGMQTVNPYLKVADAEALIDFLAATFDGELLEKHQDGERIAHAKVRIGDTVVELSSASDEWPALPAGLHVYVPDVDATHARALAAGARELHPPTDEDYGERGSAVRGPEQLQWYLATAGCPA